jgi:hypothetical protein
MAEFTANTCEASFRCILWNMEQGYVDLVAKDISSALVLEHAAADPKAAAQLDECRTWLACAQEHERVHGPLSMVNRDSPAWQTRHATLEAALLLKSMGSVEVTRTLLEHPHVRGVAQEDQEAAAQVDNCWAWVKWAEQHEVAHGKGGLIDHSHPVWMKWQRELEDLRCRQSVQAGAAD